MGESEAMESRVSAATIPPIECPIRMVRTEGSIVGDGVDVATSRSMIRFSSLVEGVLVWSAGGEGGGG